MLDIDVRTALQARLERRHRAELSNTLFVPELGVAGEVRIDVAVLNGSFSGYEIKSANDTLRRLPRQVETYSKVLDYATLVVADGHLEHARALLPSWWGIIVATRGKTAVRLKEEQPARLNREIDPRYLCTLLWRSETLDALARLGEDRGLRSKPKNILWDRLAVCLDETGLRQLVRETLKSRANWRSASS